MGFGRGEHQITPPPLTFALIELQNFQSSLKSCHNIIVAIMNTQSAKNIIYIHYIYY